MSLERRADGADPIRIEPVTRLARPRRNGHDGRGWRLATGTLACPACDAPVSPGGMRLAPAAPLGCPYCGHASVVRDFLSLAAPTRPARVVVRVVDPAQRLA